MGRSLESVRTELQGDALRHRLVSRLMLLSIGAAVATIGLKSAAAWLTGSVGFLSDAVESLVNLVAALVGLVAVRTAAKPADATHHFGHGKAEYLSAAVEGAMILVAALAIVATSIERLVHPRPIEDIGVGLALSVAAAVVNLVVGLLLIRAGSEHRSMTLQADGKHLMTDVYTTGGVLVGIVLVSVSHWQALDPIIGLLVGVNIVRTGYQLLRRSTSGLLGASLPASDAARVEAIIARYQLEETVEFHALRTSESGHQRFVYVHVLVPGICTVQHAHDLSERFEADIAAALPGTITFTHFEPIEDAASFDDIDLSDRRSGS
jgi:cation diffusion facilitator family transporter